MYNSFLIIENIRDNVIGVVKDRESVINHNKELRFYGQAYV